MSTSERLLGYFKGKHDNNSQFNVNTVASLVNLILPNFILQKPYITVKPQNGTYFKKLIDGEFESVDASRAAVIREAAINHLYKKIDAINEDRKAIQDALFFGFGICKNGYSFDTISTPDKDYIKKDSPFRKRVNPRDFGWHPLATGLDDSRYLVHRVVTTKDDVKYKNKDKISEEVPSYLKEKSKEIDGLITIYEVHDQSQDMIYTFGGKSRLLLDKRENPYDFNGSHFSQVKFVGENDEFNGIPLLGMVEGEILALNEIMTLIVEHFRKFPGQVFIEEGAIDQDDLDRIIHGEQGSVHMVKDISKILMKAPLSMGSEYFGIVNLINSTIDRVLGIPDFQRLSGSSRKSATEASFIQGDATVRRNYFIKLVKDFVVDGIEKMASLQAQFQDETMEIQASADLNSEVIKYSKDDIQGDFLFDFDVDNMSAANQARLTNINNTLNVMGSHEILHPVLKKMDPFKLGKKVMKAADIEMESLQTEEIEKEVFVSPERENQIARDNEIMPNVKKAEDHNYHERVHREDLQKNGPNEQILAHLADHMIMDQQNKAQGQPQPQQGRPGDSEQKLARQGQQGGLQ